MTARREAGPRGCLEVIEADVGGFRSLATFCLAMTLVVSTGERRAWRV